MIDPTGASDPNNLATSNEMNDNSESIANMMTVPNENNVSYNDYMDDDDDDDHETNGDEDTDQDADDDDDDDDGDDTDNESTEEDDNCSGQDNNSVMDNQPLSPNSTPTCYICLNVFEGQDIGSPDSCENMHYFCLECIEEWSKQVNTCPVDRKSFSFIMVRRIINGEIVMKVPITKQSVLEIETFEDATYCEICGRCDREDRLLLCDGCDFGYHCECLVPPLETIPVDEWFCPDCFERLFGDDIREEDNRRHLVQRRAIARTGAFERVRNRILALRSHTGTSAPPASTRRKKRKMSRRKVTKKKNQKTKKTAKTTKTRQSHKRKGRKRRTRKSKMSMKPLPAADPRSRLATRLGLVCKSPFGIPVVKPTSLNRSISEIRYSVGINNLSLFGNELEFYNPRSYGEDFEMESGYGSIGLLTNARSHIIPTVNNKAMKTPESLFQINSTDVLSEIMSSQEILHASRCDLAIARDGRVYLNPESSNNIRKCPNSSSSSPNGHSSVSATSNGNNSNSNNKNANNNNYTSSSTSSTSYERSNYSQENTQDISFIKPSPVVSLIDYKNDIEMYSDIESVGDNKDIDDSNVDDNKKLKKEKDEQNKSDQQNVCTPLKPNDPILTNNPTTKKTTITTNNDSITVKDEPILKRRPSINDLFGDNSDDDDDDDDDDELKQLVANQGSINVHFPIKMPIVLKTNFLNNKKKSTDEDVSDEVPISKKWVPIYPEMDKNQVNSGPKWKAIGNDNTNEREQSGKIANRNNNNNNKNVDYTKNNINYKKDDNRKKMDTLDSKLKLKFEEIEINKNEDIFPEINFKNKKISNNTTNDIKTTTTTTKIDDKPAAKISTTVSEQPTERTTSKDKIRTCKHGRPLNKNKESTSSTIKKRTSSETVSAENENNRTKVDFKKCDALAKRYDSDDESNRKKKSPTKSSRSYRDTMTNTDPNNHQYKEDKYSSKNSSIRDKRSESNSRYLEQKHNQTKSKHPSTISVYPKLESKLVCPEKIDKQFKTNNTNSTDSSNRKSSNTQIYKDSRHSDATNRQTNDNNNCAKESNNSKNVKHRHHHHHHHRHHHKHKHSNRSPEPTSSSRHTSSSGQQQSSKNDVKLQDKTKDLFQSSYPKMIDSKEIFAEGDKIIINVNFKKEECNTSNKKSVKEDKNDTKSSSKFDNKNIIETLSPQSSDSLVEAKSDNSIASPNDNDSTKMIKPLSSDELKNELKFLPRILPNNETTNKAVSRGSNSPVDDDLFIEDNSLLPTPTQDESQSPLLGGRKPPQSNKMKPTSNSVVDSSKDDFYDPELPLQSPDHDSIKSSKEKISFETSSLKTSLMNISRENNLIGCKESSLSGTMTTTSSKLTALNSVDFSQILQIAQTIKNQNSHGHNNNFFKQSQQKNLPNKESNHDIIEIVDMDVDSPNLSPTKPNSSSYSSSLENVKEIWGQIAKTTSSRLENSSKINNGTNDSKRGKFDFLDSQPSSAVDMEIKEKYIKKLNRQERVVEEVKLALKPYYQKKKINKEEYKDILRKAVPKICHSKSGEINPSKIIKLVEAYIKHIRHKRKKA